jgi:hypothetical protein
VTAPTFARPLLASTPLVAASDCDHWRGVPVTCLTNVANISDILTLETLLLVARIVLACICKLSLARHRPSTE